tara:strand:- start:5 stop:277 length:273 start_codon:yes stop_codon:yes gene_type:complete
MGFETIEQSHFQDEKLELKDLLETYSLKMGNVANIFGALFFIANISKHLLESNGYLAKTIEHEKVLDLGKLLELLIITLSLVIAIIPEGL